MNLEDGDVFKRSDYDLNRFRDQKNKRIFRLILLAGGRNYEFVYCGLWLVCEYVIILYR